MRSPTTNASRHRTALLWVSGAAAFAAAGLLAQRPMFWLVAGLFVVNAAVSLRRNLRGEA